MASFRNRGDALSICAPARSSEQRAETVIVFQRNTILAHHQPRMIGCDPLSRPASVQLSPQPFEQRPIPTARMVSEDPVTL
jgi:hypothetical protein